MMAVTEYRQNIMNIGCDSLVYISFQFNYCKYHAAPLVDAESK